MARVRYSYLVYVLKMEYVSKINIFGLKMMVKSSLEKNILKIPPWRKPFKTLLISLKKERIQSKNTIFGLKMMVKSSLEKISLKFLHAEDYFPLLHKRAQNHKFSNKNNYLPAWRDFKINFSRQLFTIIFRPKIVILDTDSILRVKTMVC